MERNKLYKETRNWLTSRQVIEKATNSQHFSSHLQLKNLKADNPNSRK